MSNDYTQGQRAAYPRVGAARTYYPPASPEEAVELSTIGNTVQRHELIRPFRTALATGLGFAVAGVVVLLVAFLLVFVLVEANSSSSAKSPTGISCDDGSTPTVQDGGLICNDGSLPG